jgi:thioredoxin
MNDDYDPDLEKILAKKKQDLEEYLQNPSNIPQVVSVVPKGIQELTDANFDQFIADAQVPVLVDVYADWCQPCKAIEPIIKQMSQKYEGKMIFAKLNADFNARTAGKYQMFSIPTLMFFSKGKLAGRIVGAVPAPKIETAIRTVLKAA